MNTIAPSRVVFFPRCNLHRAVFPLLTNFFVLSPASHRLITGTQLRGGYRTLLHIPYVCHSRVDFDTQISNSCTLSGIQTETYIISYRNISHFFSSLFGSYPYIRVGFHKVIGPFARSRALPLTVKGVTTLYHRGNGALNQQIAL